MRNKLCIISIIFAVLFLSSAKVIFAEIEKVEIGVDGLSCPFCVWGLEKKLKEVKSIDKISVHLKQSKAEISLKPNTPLNIASIKKAVKEAGFSVSYIYIIAIGNLAEGKDQLLFYIKDIGQEFLVYETDAVSKDKLSEIAKSNVTVRVEGKIHEHKEVIPSLGVEKIELRR